MIGVSTFYLVIMTIIAVPIIATVIYYIIYRNRIKKRLSDEIFNTKTAKPMMSPVKFFFIWLLSVLGIYFLLAIVSGIIYIYEPKMSDTTNSNETYFYFQSYDKDTKNQGFLSDITADKEIKGYKRFVEKDDNFILTYYISSTGDFNFPEVIVNVKYTGSTDPFNIHGDCQIDSCGQGIYTEGKDLDNNSQWFTINRGNMIDDDVDLTFDIYDAKKYNADNFDEGEQNPSATIELNLTNDEIEDIIE